MRSILLRGGVLAAISLAAACNSIIGVDDVSLVPPDAAPLCNVNSNFGLVVSNPSTTDLYRRTSDGGPSLLFLLNTDTKPDVLDVSLYDNMGGHGILNKVGSYTLTAGDAKLETCGICVGVYVDFDRDTSMFSQSYLALAQGSLVLTTVDSTRMAGRLQGLKFRHVNNSGGSTKDINDGCFVTIDDVQFDMTYE